MDGAFWVNPKRATVVQVMPWGNRNILVMANYTITESLSLLKLCLEEIKLFFQLESQLDNAVYGKLPRWQVAGFLCHNLEGSLVIQPRSQAVPASSF